MFEKDMNRNQFLTVVRKTWLNRTSFAVRRQLYYLEPADRFAWYRANDKIVVDKYIARLKGVWNLTDGVKLEILADIGKEMEAINSF